MKEIKMFMFESCPHCAKARKIISSLLDSNPEYKKIPFVMIDEKLQPEEAEKCDYFYVPCFFVGDEKVHEGTVDEEKVRAVFERAAE